MAIVPIDQARELGIEELFFSFTDRKGRITSGNNVFTRVSVYSAEEMYGSPHNIVRHPDMPRAIFQLFWEYLDARRPIAAYVKNMAKDGRYYWVAATTVPVGDGYLSVRLVPSSPLFETVKGMYAELRELEREIEGPDGLKRKPAMDASRKRLAELLAAAGFADYDAFMRTLMVTELKSRDAAIRSRTELVSHDVTGRGTIHDTIASCEVVRGRLAHLSTRLGSIVDEELAAKSAFVLHLAEEVRLLSMNALLAAEKVGAAGQGLGAVAAIMGTRSDETAERVGEVDAVIRALIDRLGEMSFTSAVSRLQSEMAAFFLNEIIADDVSGTDDSTSASVTALAGVLDQGFARAFSAIDAVEADLTLLVRNVEALERVLKTLWALEVSGRVEAARVDGAESFRLLFDTIRDQVQQAVVEVGALGKVTEEVRRVLDETDRVALLDHVRRIAAGAESLAAVPV